MAVFLLFQLVFLISACFFVREQKQNGQSLSRLSVSLFDLLTHIEGEQGFHGDKTSCLDILFNSFNIGPLCVGTQTSE